MSATQVNDVVQSTSTPALPEMVDISSGSPTNSDVEVMSDESECMLSSCGDQIEDVDISFASSYGQASESHGTV